MYEKLLEEGSKKAIYDSDRPRLRKLNEERELIFEELSKTPSNSLLVNRLNAIEVRIAAITGESAIELSID